MNKNKAKTIQHNRRKIRVRKKVIGTAERPRLTAYRSLRHIYAQLIDDHSGVTLVSASTRGDLDGQAYGGNKQAATQVGTALARKAREVGIRQVAFDRNGYQYHGRMQALADAAREGGLVF